MRRTAALGVVALAAALLVAVPRAGAVGTGNPVITAPAAGAVHYSGFTGPFVVDFENAPIATYDYFVDRVPSGGGAPVLVGSKQTQAVNGSITEYHFTVPALPAGSGYAFHVTDNAGHETSLAFTVTAGSPPKCSIVLPSQVRMKARSSLVTATLSAQCKTLKTVYAAWKVTRPGGGFAQTFLFDNVRTDTWRIYDDERTGVYAVRPNAARNSSNGAVPQNTTSLTMRMDSRMSLTASRSGSYVTLRTRSTRYSPSANTYKAWAGRTVVLAYRTCGTCAWKQLKIRTTSHNGVTSYRFRAVKARQYRATAAGTSTTWAPRAAYVSR